MTAMADDIEYYDTQCDRPIKHTKRIAPKVGDLCTVRGLACKITKVLPFGTIEVQSLETNQAFRVSGLPLQ